MPKQLLGNSSLLSQITGLLLLLFCVIGCQPKATDKQAPPSNTQVSVKPRIVSLAPSVTEMLYAIGAGDQLVGRTSACDFPEEAKKVPVTGAFGKPSLEMLASIHPDMVIAVDLEDKRHSDKIQELGIRMEQISCTTPDEIPEALRTLGRLTGNERQADSLANVISKGLADFRKQAPPLEQRPTMYLELWDDPFWTGGKKSYTSALIAAAGGRNIGDVVDKDYFEISQEWVIKKNPDVIACMYMARNASATDKVMQRSGWNTIKAVQQKRVYDHFDNSLFLRPSPRVLQGIGELHKTLYPVKSDKNQ